MVYRDISARCYQPASDPSVRLPRDRRFPLTDHNTTKKPYLLSPPPVAPEAFVCIIYALHIYVMSTKQFALTLSRLTRLVSSLFEGIYLEKTD
jgi:hypothetical protein